MIEKCRDVARSWLRDKQVDAIFGLKSTAGRSEPFLFNTEAELADLVISNRHRICHTLRPSHATALALMLKKDPQIRIGVVCRGCDERALIELAKRAQLALDRIKILGVACTVEEAAECVCTRPFPTELTVGEKIANPPVPSFEELLQLDPQQRFAFWQHALTKCMKCYGCRNSCPVCFCKECKMEQELHSRVGRLPPDVPMFQFIRLCHVADKCIGCGECERACPCNIPLNLITKLMKRDVKELFGYEAGLDVEQDTPLVLTLDDAPVKEDARLP
jgi:ferredoxin